MISVPIRSIALAAALFLSSCGKSDANLQKAASDGFKASLALVFISIKQDREAIVELLDKAGLAIYGTTTNGEFIDESYEQGSIAILLLDIHPDYFFIQYADLNGDEKAFCRSHCVCHGASD